jgi:hypothetical protein
MLSRPQFFVLALLVTQPLLAQQHPKPQPLLGCAPAAALGCGCAIRVENLVCPAPATSSQPQLFTGLERKDPLHLQLGGSHLELPHTRHRGAASKGDRGGRWADEYISDGVFVRISYSPSTASCPKPKAEGCEFTDYVAQVLLRPNGHAPQVFVAKARCGC